jgi:hypothetical protein
MINLGVDDPVNDDDIEPGANLYGVDLPGADLSGADLSGSTLSEADLSGANLSSADLYNTDLYRADLSGADLSGATVSKANLSKINLSDASLSNADLSDANLSGADFSDADLSSADFSSAYVFDINLSGADLSDTSLSNESSVLRRSVVEFISVEAVGGGGWVLSQLMSQSKTTQTEPTATETPQPPGKLLWSYVSESGSLNSPEVGDGKVYIKIGNNLYAISAGDATVQWRFRPDGGVTLGPTVINGNVYIRDGQGNVYAVSADSGSKQWRWGGLSNINSLTVSGDMVIITRQDSRAIGLSDDDGSVQWISRFDDLVVKNRSVYIMDNTSDEDISSVYALSADGGSERWKFQTGDELSSPPIVSDDTVYVTSGNGFYALST